ncbi:dedicator of cytokinesis protein 9-like [Ctenocephalides felis]|uniref:dedicator of cytokinesis protein 9-like n=1 Tax=Ctenocephalides felis TaxID=7515 RepID=UPI000E6E132D|nr:dedicator of cytokinesis protein 9-like [Ctenocephalides felis]
MFPGVHETQYTEQQLLDQLEACAESLELSERYELLGSLYRLILPIHERRRDYEALAACYGRLREACLRVAEVARTGKRLLGRMIYTGCPRTQRQVLTRLPKSEPMREELFEVDTDADQIDDVMSRSHSDGIRKQGHLLKGPDTSSDRMFAHIGSKSFKRRYCYLRQEVDGTYILELHKDEKKGDAKATIVMDFCTDVVTNTKKGRYGFELKMIEGHRSYTLAADCEAEMQDWVAKLKAVIEQIKLQEEKRAASLERAPPSPAPSPALTYGTLKGLEQSMNPQLIRYSRETDISIASSRKEGRRRLFSGYVQPNKATPQPNVEPYKEQFGQRISLVCESLKFRLQAPVDGEKETLCQVEPYFTSLCLYDARANRKLTENFYFDVNHDVCRKLLEIITTLELCCTNGTGDDKKSATNGHSPTAGDGMKNGCSGTNGSAGGDGEECGMFDAKWIEHPRQAILSVTNPHPDVFLVVRIDKVLQGGICNTSEPYLKATKDPRLGLKVHKSVKTYCQRLGQYRMPFAWAARPLFRLYSNELDTTSEFPSIYRQEGHKLKDEDLLKLLADYRKPDKLNKLTVVPGWLKISLQPIVELPENCLTTSLIPLRPFPNPPTCEPTIEIAEFQSPSDRDVHPYTVFTNHLYVYPQSLMFDTPKIFNRARNIGCIVELRDSDAKDAQPLKCIYGRPGGLPLTTRVICPVVHHNTTPTFYEEVKIRLPITLDSSHHILFTFMHISCEISKKKDCNSDSCVGYAWIPLISKGKLNLDTQTIAVSTHLPPGYLSIQPLGLGKGNAGPEITWIDSQRPLFTIAFNLNSTVLTQDIHLQNLFTHAEKLVDNKPSAIPSESETCKILKAAHAIQTVTVITFLPTILNQLFALLVITNSEEVGHNIIRLLVHIIHMIHESGRNDILLSYVKTVENMFFEREMASFTAGSALSIS